MKTMKSQFALSLVSMFCDLVVATRSDGPCLSWLSGSDSASLSSDRITVLEVGAAMVQRGAHKRPSRVHKVLQGQERHNKPLRAPEGHLHSKNLQNPYDPSI